MDSDESEELRYKSSCSMSVVSGPGSEDPVVALSASLSVIGLQIFGGAGIVLNVGVDLASIGGIQGLIFSIFGW